MRCNIHVGHVVNVPHGAFRNEEVMYERERDAALKAVELAGTYLLDAYAQFQVIPDAPANITTDADRRAQEIVLTHLHRHFPGDACCAEEETAALAGKSPTGPRLWIVDPIGGTRGFAQKNGEFSVMVALRNGDRVVVGVVLEPVLWRVTYAV